MNASDQQKNREIMFSALPVQQAKAALALLEGMQDLNVEMGNHDYSIVVHYDVCNYTLEKLESALQAHGLHLDNSLLQKLRRALIYFCERNQRDNLSVPPQQQKFAKPFVEAFQHHPHGDQDDTPEEWRSYK
ncbi:MAG: hypothetical protein ACYCY1_08670 [Sulfuriferula sp.]